MKPTPKETKKIHENYEKVVKHLIEEKYAVDGEAADKSISSLKQSSEKTMNAYDYFFSPLHMTTITLNI